MNSPPSTHRPEAVVHVSVGHENAVLWPPLLSITFVRTDFPAPLILPVS